MGPSEPWQGRIQRLGAHWAALSYAHSRPPDCPLARGEGPRHLRVRRLQIHTCLDACQEGMEWDADGPEKSPALGLGS